MASLKFLIVGAGVGGPAAAYWLSQIPNSSITVIESQPSLRNTGQQIDLRGQGIVVTKLMGIEQAVRSVLVHEPGTRIVNSKGQTQAYMAVNSSGKGRQGATSEFEIMRGDLVNVLYEATRGRENVKYVFDCQIKSFTQDEGGSAGGNKVHVTFKDWRQEDYDIVIGADGVNSSTRRLMLGPDFPDPRRDLGVHIAFFTAPTIDSDTRDFTISNIVGGRIIMLRKDKPENVRVYFTVRHGCEKLDQAKTLQDQKDAVADMFKGAEGWQLQRVLRDLVKSPEADDLYCHHEQSVRLPEGTWSRGQVVLIGDAANGSGANGFGTSSALIQAYVLAGEIANRWKASQEETEATAFNFQDAAQEFERIIRPIIKDRPTWLNQFFLPETATGIWILHTISWFLTKFRILEFIGRLLPDEVEKKLEFKDYFGLRSQYGV